MAALFATTPGSPIFSSCTCPCACGKLGSNFRSLRIQSTLKKGFVYEDHGQLLPKFPSYMLTDVMKQPLFKTSHSEYIPDIIPFRPPLPKIDTASIGADLLSRWCLNQDVLATSWVEFYGPLFDEAGEHGEYTPPEEGIGRYAADQITPAHFTNGLNGGQAEPFQEVDLSTPQAQIRRELSCQKALLISKFEKIERQGEVWLEERGFDEVPNFGVKGFIAALMDLEGTGTAEEVWIHSQESIWHDDGTGTGGVIG